MGSTLGAESKIKKDARHIVKVEGERNHPLHWIESPGCFAVYNHSDVEKDVQWPGL